MYCGVEGGLLSAGNDLGIGLCIKEARWTEEKKNSKSDLVCCIITRIGVGLFLFGMGVFFFSSYLVSVIGWLDFSSDD